LLFQHGDIANDLFHGDTLYSKCVHAARFVETAAG
jgi:hypothetical protein